jgi:hypothetical protein
MNEMRAAYITLVTITWICSFLMFAILIIILRFSKHAEGREWKYNLDRNSKIFKMQVGIFAVGGITTAVMDTSSMTSEARDSPFVYDNGFYNGNLLCTIGFRLGSVLFVLFHFFNYMFLMQKANASNAIPSNPLLGKLLYLATCSVPLYAIAVAILNSGQFDSDIPEAQRTNSDYFCTAHIKWEMPVIFGFMDTLLQLGYLIYFILPLRQVLQNFSQLRAALVYKPVEGDIAEKKKRLIAVTARNFVACAVSVASTMCAVVSVAIGNSEVPVTVRLCAYISVPFNVLACGLASLYATSGAWENQHSIRDQKVVALQVSSQGSSAKPKDPTQTSPIESRDTQEMVVMLP